MARAINFRPPRRKIHSVFVHCSASDRPEHDSVEVMRSWHLDRGWSDVGYHYFIRKDGTIEVGRPVARIPAAQRGHNRGSIAICLHGLDQSRFTPAQFESLLYLAQVIDEAFRGRSVEGLGLRWRGHCEVARKACPVFDYRRVLGLDRDGRLLVREPDTSAQGADPEPKAPSRPRLLKLMSRGDDVRALQRRLNASGAELTVDGIFGQKTREAVEAFQAEHGLKVDGLVGAGTRAALEG